jgi:hypothetical protein
MANSEVRGKRFLQVVLDGTGDWISGNPTASATLPGVVFRPKGLVFSVSGATDVLIVREGSITGPIAVKLKAAAATDTLFHYFYGDAPLLFAIDYSECTFGTVGNAVISFEFD